MKPKSFLLLSVVSTLLQLGVAQRPIPGTDLRTQTPYRLGLKTFPKGTVTWTAPLNSTYNYVQIDNDPDHAGNYDRNGVWHNDALWEFIPILNARGDETTWYGLRNKGREGAYVVYETTDSANGNSDSYHVVLNKNWQSKGQTHVLEPITVTRGGQTYYKIKFMNLPIGAVTYTARHYGNKGSRYIQVDDNPDNIGKYGFGGDWDEDSLITISTP